MPLFSANPLAYQAMDSVHVQWSANTTVTALSRWRDLVAENQAAYNRFAVSLRSTASAITLYSQAWADANNTVTVTGANNNWYQQGITIDFATPENEARWRREKLELLRASKRARKTLIKFLDTEQLASYAATGRFKVVASNGWVFELRKGGNPLLLGDDGHADASFCIHPRERFPAEDKILSFMLLLMSDVEDFLRIANRTTIRQRQLSPTPGIAAHEPLPVEIVQSVVVAA